METFHAVSYTLWAWNKKEKQQAPCGFRWPSIPESFFNLLIREKKYPLSVFIIPFFPRNIISETIYFFCVRITPNSKRWKRNDGFKDSAGLLIRNVMTQVGKLLSINRTVRKTFGPHFKSFKDIYKLYTGSFCPLSLLPLFQK